MLVDIDTVGFDWLVEQMANLTDEIKHISPVAFNEDYRYLPASVTSMPGYIRYDVNPFMKEIIECFDVKSPVREVNLMKGVQITYSTALESVAFYYMGHVKTLPIMYLTADKELAEARIENNFIPMINQSGFSHIIRSSDEGNTRKTGKSKKHIQFEGGGYLVPFGAQNANKMRSFSIAIMLKDEIDGWPDRVGKDGEPDNLSDARCSAYWERRKIFRGSTPLIKSTSKILSAYKRGDQRKYMVLCKSCSFPQELRWNTVNKDTGIIGGFIWETDGDTLLLDSVRYCCQSCGFEHYEHDKERLFSPHHGAHWKPTAKPSQEGIRSYHLPALYSPVGMLPWYKCVSDFLEAFDPIEKRVKKLDLFQTFYNNILAEPFEVSSSKVGFRSVSAHRRAVYRLGEIPNEFAKKFSQSAILFLTCQVDVQEKYLSVSVMGWTKDFRCYVIDYWTFDINNTIKDDYCTLITSSTWGRLQEIIEEKEYVADDGQKYKIITTLIDSGYANDTVVRFCASYASGVYPILGRDRPAKNQTIKEFGQFKTQSGTIGYRIVVDHYKERIASVLRRSWAEELGEQKPYHFNAPVDLSDKALRELTVESRREKTDDNGNKVFYWHRPAGVANELFDLLVYGHAAVEILAYSICIEHFKMETIDWPKFWEYLETGKVFST